MHIFTAIERFFERQSDPEDPYDPTPTVENDAEFESESVRFDTIDSTIFEGRSNEELAESLTVDFAIPVADWQVNYRNCTFSEVR